MNNLKAITESRGITPIELSKMSGVSLTRVRQLIKDGTIDTAFKSTQNKIAKALGVTVRDLVKGGNKVKENIIKAEIAKATEHLARLLRNYSDEELYLHITVFTRDKECECDDFQNEVPDYFDYRLAILMPEDVTGDIAETIVNKSGLIYYSDVGGEAYIKKVIPYKEYKNE